MNVVALSGGKDSSALSLRLAELGEDFCLLFTPTGDESDDCIDHIAKIAGMVQKKLHVKSCGKSLYNLIEGYNALPNNRQRWCTRQLKIEPAKAFLLEHPGSTLLVGLRADEEHREGMWGEFATYRYPMREWGWGIGDVYAYLEQREVKVPERTDCLLCYDKRLHEWWQLWKDHPDKWARGEAFEEMTGHTFRSPTRDTWPASMKGLRLRFEAGDTPKQIRTLPLFDSYEVVKTKEQRCRVCSM